MFSNIFVVNLFVLLHKIIISSHGLLYFYVGHLGIYCNLCRVLEYVSAKIMFTKPETVFAV